MSTSKLSLGIIGTGIAVRDLHLPAFKDLKDLVTITGVCNRTKSKAQEFAKTCDTEGLGPSGKAVRVYANAKALCKDPTIDAVLIAVPIEQNLKLTKLAASFGKHVLVEKPLAHNLKAAKAMQQLEMAYPELLLMLAENFRYRDTLKIGKEYLDDGLIGRPYSAIWESATKMDESIKWANTSWRINHQYEGGFVTDAGVHNIALLRELFGDLKCIGSTKTSVNPSIGRMDTFQALFKSDSGVAIQFSMFFSAQQYESFHLRILGDRGTMTIGWDFIELANNEKTINKKIDDAGGYTNQMKFFAEHALRVMKGGAHPAKSTFGPGFKDLETLLIAIKIAK